MAAAHPINKSVQTPSNVAKMNTVWSDNEGGEALFSMVNMIQTNRRLTEPEKRDAALSSVISVGTYVYRSRFPRTKLRASFTHGYVLVRSRQRTLEFRIDEGQHEKSIVFWQEENGRRMARLSCNCYSRDGSAVRLLRALLALFASIDSI